jgi:hypothetical protein
MTAEKMFPFESFNWNVEAATAIPPLGNAIFQRSDVAGLTKTPRGSMTTLHHRHRRRDKEQRETHEEHYPGNLGGYYRDARKSEHCREDCDDKTNDCIVQHDPLSFI